MMPFSNSASVSLLVGLGTAAVLAVIFNSERNKSSPSSEKSTNGKPRRRTIQDDMKDGSLVVHPIGCVESIYRLCVGTPRQGLLAPQARGRIRLENAHAVDGLADYSHIWIVFVFHLNTPHKGVKIAPPALGGRKVGVLATRSPHRFNPVGITLAKLDRVVPQRGGGATLELSGLDLVDGTPVLDVKPYVSTYDAPIDGDVLRVPHWVSGGLHTQRAVDLSLQACESLQTILQAKQTRFYGPRSGETVQEGYESLSACIRQVLAMDVRSAYQTKKVREGKSQAELASRVKAKKNTSSSSEGGVKACTQQIDNLLVHFTVESASNLVRPTSEGSGAEDAVFVTQIEVLEPL